MGDRAKIVMMGGGSNNWGPRSICDMLLEPVLNGSEVFLLDPDLAAAEEVKAACCKMNETLGAGFSFKSTSSEEYAFSGADFVVIAISTGGLNMMAHDLKIRVRG